ncbi:MAG: hypothetical protein Q7R54_00475 [bacterium]|nr:hypothetical protein [bacterium]
MRKMFILAVGLLAVTLTACATSLHPSDQHVRATVDSALALFSSPQAWTMNRVVYEGSYARTYTAFLTTSAQLEKDTGQGDLLLGVTEYPNDTTFWVIFSASSDEIFEAEDWATKYVRVVIRDGRCSLSDMRLSDVGGLQTPCGALTAEEWKLFSDQARAFVRQKRGNP